jgi:hypothetical protein
MERRSASLCIRLTIATALAAGTAAPVAAAAHGHGPIKPRQHFTAAVNGSDGASGPVVISMACFGPTQPGQTGHPFGGQTLSVQHASPHTAGAGDTGPRGASIGAFFGALPPTPSGSSYVLFTRYGTQPIPTSLVLPCAGTSSVNFVPLPINPGSQDVSVPVSFVGQP